MNWFIGQEIVCVRAHPDSSLVRGKTYTIKALCMAYCSCSHILIDVGIRFDPSRGNRCVICDFRYNSGGIGWYNESRFAPLDQDISELTEILEQPIKQVQEI
jgi:hypothetical protein